MKSIPEPKAMMITKIAMHNIESSYRKIPFSTNDYTVGKLVIYIYEYEKVKNNCYKKKLLTSFDAIPSEE